MSDPEDWDEDDWDITDDPSFEERAAEWADKKSQDLKAEWAAWDLEQTIERAHETAWPRVQRALELAAQRESEAKYDEATLHLARALEGYLREVFLNPTVEQLLAPYSDNRRAALIEVLDIVPSSLVGRTPKRLLIFALLGVTGDIDVAKAITKAIAATFNSLAWSMRNRVVHSLHVPDKAAVVALSDVVRSALDTVSAPLVKQLAEKAERVAEAERQRGRIRSFEETFGFKGAESPRAPNDTPSGEP